jgi:predicted PP-loop superfamily ATPase
MVTLIWTLTIAVQQRKSTLAKIFSRNSQRILVIMDLSLKMMKRVKKIVMRRRVMLMRNKFSISRMHFSKMFSVKNKWQSKVALVDSVGSDSVHSVG